MKETGFTNVCKHKSLKNFKKIQPGSFDDISEFPGPQYMLISFLEPN